MKTKASERRRNRASSGSTSSAVSAVDVAALRDMARRLEGAFGPQHWWPAQTPFEVMVGAVLTQNTNWKNVERAIANLKRAKALSPKGILALTPARLRKLITPAGYFRVKEKRLRSLVEWFQARTRGRLALLKATPTGDLREELLSVHGVGPETADSILLYALGRPVFVVDAYTRRVLERHGLLRGGEPYDLIREAFERAIAGRNRTRRMNELHAQIVELAKRHCRARRSCEGCPLEKWMKPQMDADERR